ncbi:hypothetical protein [Noviherbaspirillum sp.]|nr:hypothetical protein [Noviherbaspirillum sp.]
MTQQLRDFFLGNDLSGCEEKAALVANVNVATKMYAEGLRKK